MKYEVFAVVEEAALETVAGGLFDTLNGSLNCNTVSFLSNIGIAVCTGDINSNNGNIGNEIG